MEPFKPAPAEAETQQKPTILTLEYGNKSSKASLQLDLTGTDVQIEMSGSRTKSDTAWRSAPAPSPYAQAPQQTQNNPTGQPVVVNVTSGQGGSQGRQQAFAGPEDSGTMRVRRIVDSTVTITTNKTPDSTLRRVVQNIRKSQELFYAGRYAEAEDNARRANELKPTAEGLALAGSIAWVRKDKEGARRNWTQARELDPDFPGLANMLDSAATPRQELSR